MLCARACWIGNSSSCHICQCRYSCSISEPPLSVWRWYWGLACWDLKFSKEAVSLIQSVLEAIWCHVWFHLRILSRWDKTNRTWGLLWSCWNPLSHICKWSALHSCVEVYSTCVSFTHWWLSAAAAFESVIHRSTFPSEHMAAPAESFLPDTRLSSECHALDC